MLEAVKNGAVHEHAEAKLGQTYWKLIRADGPEPWGGRHSIFIDVWDEQGKRIVGVPVHLYWNDGGETKPTELKPGEPFAMDFPIFAARPSYGVRVVDGLPSDELWGMGLEPFQPHVVYKLIFQRTVAGEQSQPSVPGKDKIQVVVNGQIVWEN